MRGSWQLNPKRDLSPQDTPSCFCSQSYAVGQPTFNSTPLTRAVFRCTLTPYHYCFALLQGFQKIGKATHVDEYTLLSSRSVLMLVENLTQLNSTSSIFTLSYSFVCEPGCNRPVQRLFLQYLVQMQRLSHTLTNARRLLRATQKH